MLAIPVKKTKGASIKSIVAFYLKKAGDYSPAFDEVLLKYDALRTQAIANDATIANVKSYLAQLLYFEENFPVTGPDAAPDLRLSYNWRSAFQSSGQFLDCRFIVEKAATLFNLAAQHTFEGQKLDDPAAMKLCCEHWSNAAGIFKFIRTELGPNLGASGGSDLKPVCLQTLEFMCYAAVQAAVFNRAHANSMKPKNLASISAGVVTLLERSVQAMQSDGDVRALLSSVDIGKLLPLQLDYFRIVSHIHQAEAKRLKAEEEAVGYGHYVSRLRLAQSLVTSLAGKIPRKPWAKQLQDTVAALAKDIDEKSKLAEEENRLLYVEQVPPSKDLEEIKPHMMKMADETRAPPFDKAAFLKSTEPSLFAAISPEVIKLKKMIAAKAEELKGIGATRAEQNEAVKAALDGDGDGAAAAATGGDAPTPELWEKVAQFQATGLKGIHEDIASVTEIKKNLTEQLEGMEKQLAEEAAADEANRSAHGSSWTLPPSSEAAKAIKESVQKFRQQIEQAASGDAKTAETVETHTELLTWLQTPKADLEAEASSPAPEAVDAPNPQQYLDATIAKLMASQEQSNELFAQLVDSLSKLDIEAGVAALPADTATADLEASVSTVLAQPLQLHGQLTQVLAEQKGVCASVTALRASVNNYKAKLNSGSSQKLAELRAKLQNGLDRFAEITNFVAQGKNYYASLQQAATKHALDLATYCSGRRAASKAEAKAVVQKQQEAAAEAARQKQIELSLKQTQEREAQLQAQRLQAQREAQAREAQRQQQLRQQQEAARRYAPAPVQPHAPVVAPVVAPPAMMSLTVTIPAGTGPGGQFRARLPDGRECMVTVPAGMYAGSQLSINVPAAPPPQVASTIPAPVVPTPAAPVPFLPPSGMQPVPHSGFRPPGFDMSIYTAPQREAINQMKNFAMNSSYEQCADYLLRHNFDVQQAVQAFYRDNVPR